jgi:hypothetical protein
MCTKSTQQNHEQVYTNLECIRFSNDLPFSIVNLFSISIASNNLLSLPTPLND